MLSGHIWDRELLYSSHLAEISNIKFTFREIDVIACIIHNRGEKKIASLLNISYRTVGVHVRNIMSKLGYSSREYLIDFVEKSGKLKILRQYYSELLIEFSFKKHLEKLSRNIKTTEVVFSCDKNKMSDIEKNLLHWIKESLSIINIKCRDRSPADDKNDREEDSTHVVFSKETKLDARMSKKAKYITLTMDKNSAYLDKDITFINFAQNPFIALFKLVEKITNNSEVSDSIKAFESEYEGLDNSFESEKIFDNLQTIQNKNIVTEKNNLFLHRTKLFFLFWGVLLVGFVYYWSGGSQVNDNTNSDKLERDLNEVKLITNTEKTQISEIEQKLVEFTYKFKPDNLNPKQRQQNEEYLNELEALVNLIQNNKDVRHYFITEASPRSLINYVHNAFSLSAYYFYSQHDGKKGREILSSGKEIIESFLNSRNRGPEADFDELINRVNSEAIYTELSIIEDLPETYTKVLYEIGRSYVYDNNINEGEKYFRISSKLGRKLGLFEGFLADVSGLGRILIIESEYNLKNEKTKEARVVLEKVIKLYSALKKDKSKYIINYHPKLSHYQNKEVNVLNSKKAKQTVIIPGNDVYNLARCNVHLLNAYRRLLLIENSQQQKTIILQEISSLIHNNVNYPNFISKNTLKGELEDDELGRKEKAVINIAIANLLLALEKESTKLKEENPEYLHAKRKLTGLIEKQIIFNNASMINYINQNIKDNNNSGIYNIDFAYELFKRAEGQSRNTDFTKADAHYGMAQTLKLMIQMSSHLTSSETVKIEKEIKAHEIESKNINKSLSRVPAGV